MQTARDIASIINPNPAVLTVEIQNRRSLVLFGVTAGSTDLRFVDATGSVFSSTNVTVAPDLAPLQDLLRKGLGEPAITLVTSGATVVMTGDVSTSGKIPLAADLVQKTLGGATGLVNLLHSVGNDQITVSVKVLEIKSATLRSMGIKWTANNGRAPGGVNQLGNVFGSTVLARPTDQFSLAASSTFRVSRTVIDAFVDFLRTEGNAKLLAEPTIVATSGKPAKFLSGGEIPVPVPYGYGGVQTTTTGQQVNNSFSSIIYKQYGTSLNMTATITPDGRIDLQLNPEVSSIDYANAIEYGGNRVPALATRRAETELRLDSGETVILAGLTSDAESNTRARLPIGPRFLDFLAGPSAKNTDKVELVIIVTPVLGARVQPGPAIEASLQEPKP